ncbi:MAG: hypothetical protein EOM53_01125 [Alphaproteobacteria bacterium]|nr:hypothetical protein [Alphaproteobacteria bacterium]NCB49269.1 hypothetical protein [Alphaproteobacteria bacterium]
MTDKKKIEFAPPPPFEKKEIVSENKEELSSEFPQEEKEFYGLYDNNFAADLNLPPKLLETKVMGMILGGIFLFGIVFGSILFGGSSSPLPSTGLQGVVQNKDIVSGRSRCGIAERGDGCILYLMNSTRREKRGSSFYEEAARLTGVPQYSISMANVQYAETIIRPGYIAKINIPPLN